MNKIIDFLDDDNNLLITFAIIAIISAFII
jgi:hypothetical protein